MCEENLWALWFQSVPGIGRRTIYHLAETFGSLRQAAAASEEELCTVLRPPQIKSLREFSQTPDGLMRQCERAGAEYVTVREECFPGRLKEIPDPPYGLFVKGSLPDPDRPAVAMIGARACSTYGREAARLMGSAAAAAGIQVISGMARGIDSISQRACLDGGGKSIAVLGSGVDICYPPEARTLYEQLASEGGIISEYPLHMQPLNKNFPPRNRLISGLADLVLVIEAREKSGTLITVDMALEQGREVAVVPGRITDALSQGCHKLYSQGAHLVTSAQEMTQMVWNTFALRQENIDRRGVRKIAVSRNDSDAAGDIVVNKDGIPGFSLLSGERKNSSQSGKGLNGPGAEEAKPAYDLSLSPFLNQLLNILDMTPQSVEALYRFFQENDGQADLSQFLTGLMELELAGKCQTVGGMYARRV